MSRGFSREELPKEVREFLDSDPEPLYGPQFPRKVYRFEPDHIYVGSDLVRLQLADIGPPNYLNPMGWDKLRQADKPIVGKGLGFLDERGASVLPKEMIFEISGKLTDRKISTSLNSIYILNAMEIFVAGSRAFERLSATEVGAPEYHQYLPLRSSAGDDLGQMVLFDPPRLFEIIDPAHSRANWRERNGLWRFSTDMLGGESIHKGLDLKIGRDSNNPLAVFIAKDVLAELKKQLVGGLLY